MRYFGINPKSFGQLAVFKKQIEQNKTDLKILKVEFLRPYCIAYLDQILQTYNKEKQLFIGSIYPKANQYLKQVGFEFVHSNSKGCESFKQEEIICVKRFTGSLIEVEEQVVHWILNDIIPFLPTFEDNLRKKIVKNLWEIINNGLSHGEGEFGVSACGQFYPLKGYFEVAFYDSGHGIPTLTRNYLKDKAPASDSECITWAVQEGNSTRPFEESAGMGLHLLRRFLTVNHGTFQIASGVGYYADDSVIPAVKLKNYIDGTLVNIRVIYDNYTYQLKGENNEDN
ncbi:MAG: hypothetical protein Q8L88_05890 [Bacteroidota bacterium]|nr:hypothetical protein [Bacteroidota bacterium]